MRRQSFPFVSAPAAVSRRSYQEEAPGLEGISTDAEEQEFVAVSGIGGAGQPANEGAGTGLEAPRMLPWRWVSGVVSGRRLGATSVELLSRLFGLLAVVLGLWNQQGGYDDRCVVSWGCDPG